MIEDALIAFDGTAGELEALLADAYEPADETTPRSIASADSKSEHKSNTALSSFEVENLVCALKVADPTYTRQQIHKLITDAGGSCSLSAVKKVRVGWCIAQARHKERQATLDRAQQTATRQTTTPRQERAQAQATAATSKGELEASKATQQTVDVVTPVGTRVFKVPSSSKQVYKSDECQQWIEADRKAWDAIMVGGNTMVRIDSIPPGTPITPCVTARRLKLDQATGELDKFKPRHAVDWPRLNLMRQKLGLPPPPTGTCNTS